jgi:hypothetical protein
LITPIFSPFIFAAFLRHADFQLLAFRHATPPHGLLRFRADFIFISFSLLIFRFRHYATLRRLAGWLAAAAIFDAADIFAIADIAATFRRFSCRHFDYYAIIAFILLFSIFSC